MENEKISPPRLETVRPIAPAKEERPNRRPFVVVGALAAVLLLGIGGYALMTRNQQNTEDAQVTADLVPVGTRVAGQVIKVNVVENQLVDKGQVLAEIDDSDYQAKVTQSEAELASAQAQAQAADAQVAVVEANSKGGLASARSAWVGSSVGVGTAEAQVQAAKAGLLKAQADLNKASLDLARAKELRAANAVPQERLDNAQAAYDLANAALAQGKAQLAVADESRRAAQEHVGEARGRLAQSSPIAAQIAAARAQADLAHARVKGAQAALELVRLQLSWTKVTAPAAGSASKLSVHQGQMVAVGQPVIELVPTETYVVANFKETQIGRMKPGQTAEIKLDAYPGRTLEGKVESLSGGTGASFSLLPADNASGNFVKVVQRVPVRIRWVQPPAGLPLRAGLSADVTVDVGN
jgi:membrane fusion protein (multidrug efflux system)